MKELTVGFNGLNYVAEWNGRWYYGKTRDEAIASAKRAAIINRLANGILSVIITATALTIIIL